jgi:RND family efflux transporter MFP subunit
MNVKQTQRRPASRIARNQRSESTEERAVQSETQTSLAWPWPIAASLILGIFAANFSLSGCQPNKSQGPIAAVQAGPPRVQTITVAKQDLAQMIEMPGTVEGFETAVLYAKVGGYLEEITVDIGDHVEQGQVLARLSIPEMDQELAGHAAEVKQAEAKVQQAQAGIRQAEAQLVSAAAMVDEAMTSRDEKESQKKFREAEFERVKKLVESESLLAKRLDEATFQLEAAEAALKSVDARVRTAEAQRAAVTADLDKAKLDAKSTEAQVAVATADLERTKTMMAYAMIKAPFAGLVTKRTVDPGAFIQPAEGNSAAKPLLTVSRIDTVRVMLDLPMAEVRWLDKGDRATLDRINVLPGEQFEGEVTRFSSALERASRTMRVEVDLPNPDQRLLPGYYGYVKLILEDFAQTPTVPSSALMTDEEGSFVYVIEDNKCQRRGVRANYKDGAIVGIAEGLSGDEQVVKAGGGQLSDGQEVMPVRAE